MKFRIVSLFPELIEAAARTGMVERGVKKKLLEVSCVNPRDFTTDAHRSVDDRPFGGGDGMIFLPDVLEKTIDSIKAHGPTKVVYLSPQGPVLTDRKARELAAEASLTLVCGRYGGIDQRTINTHVDEELSIGDYVLAGGELAAMVVVETVARLIPGVLGHDDSSSKDSFADGLLEHPNFSRPREWNGQAAPDVLLGGNHAKIQEWKLRLSQLVTMVKRPDLAAKLSADEKKKALAYFEKMSENDRRVCGLDGLRKEDFGV